MIYLDNAATTFPKPREVLERMIDLYAAKGVSPGRGAYDCAQEADELVFGVRKRLCQFFGGDDPNRVIFASNATDALNLAIQGSVKPGGHVVSSQLEHNSVLRPLQHLRASGLIDYDLIPFDGHGFIDPDDVSRAIRPQTQLVVLTHASNVLGTIQPIEAVGAVCREKRGFRSFSTRPRPPGCFPSTFPSGEFRQWLLPVINPFWGPPVLAGWS